MTPPVIFLVFVAAVFVSALFSGLETGLYATSRLRLYLDEQAGVRPAAQARALLAHAPRVLAVLLVANNLANYGASFLAQVFLSGRATSHAELVGTVVVSLILFLFAESVPKTAFLERREQLLYPAIPALYFVNRIFGPLVAPVTYVVQRLVSAVTGSHQADLPGEEIWSTGTAEGLLTPFQQRVARGVLAMRNRQAGEEALPLSAYPTTVLGKAGVQLPEGSRRSRVIVMDRAESGAIGWVPLASLGSSLSELRPVEAHELRPISRVGLNFPLDRAYSVLDRAQTPFALLPDGRVLDAHRLRQRVMEMAGG